MQYNASGFLQKCTDFVEQQQQIFTLKAAKYLKLIEKKAAKRSIKHWRPIFLINIDGKLLFLKFKQIGLKNIYHHYSQIKMLSSTKDLYASEVD